MSDYEQFGWRLGLLCLAVAMVTSAVVAGTNGVMVASHRADWQFAPENSLESLKNAIRFGADIIETDVRMTKDGHIVIMHDYAVDRTTNGSGYIGDLTLDDIRALRLRDNIGAMTQYHVPTLEEFIAVAKGKVWLYLDKAIYDLPGHEEGTLVRKLLEIARTNGTLEETVFVLPWPYEKAKRIFGDDLEKVRYCPVIEDKIPDLETYVDEYIEKLHPFAFQFRMASLDSKTYAQLPKVLAAAWSNHTAGHDDRVSIFESPDKGWGWLVEQGFTVIETNHTRDLIQYLKTKGETKMNDTIYQFSVKDRTGGEVSLRDYAGKVLLIVNTATRCGFTPQYEGLEAMYERLKGNGFELLDFPCNQFGQQAPGTDEEIHSFCVLNYKTAFPQFAKVEVNGENAAPLFQFLVANTTFGGFPQDGKLAPILEKMLGEADPDYAKKPDIKWNFTKFLVGKDGRIVRRFEPTAPLDEVESAIEVELTK